jgi:porin
MANSAAQMGTPTGERKSENPGWFRDELSAPALELRRLDTHGVALHSTLVQDLSKSVLAGAGNQDWFSRYSWDLTAEIDGQKAVRWTRGSAVVRVKLHRNTSGIADTQPMQAYSNLDAAAQTGLYEAWAQQQFRGNRIRLKAGRIDANADFATVATAADFLNSSMGYGPTLMKFSTYPDPRAGFEAMGAFGKSSQAGFGIFGAGSGTFSVLEGVHTWAAGRVAAGVWNLEQRLTRFDGALASRTPGIYAVVEQALFGQAPPGDNSPRRLQGFLQVGTGQGSVNPYTLHLGGGIVLNRPMRLRTRDTAGAAATWVRLTHAAGAGYDAGGELATEVYYKTSLPRALSLISDVQVFQHPGGVLSHSDTFIASSRMVVTF